MTRLSTSTVTPNDAYFIAITQMKNNGEQVSSRVEDTVELHPAIMTIEEPTDRLITAFGRPVNVAFALAEILWIFNGLNTVDPIASYNNTITDYSDDGQHFNAAYGWRIRREFGHDQLDDIIELLQQKPDTRQAVMSIWSPTHDRASQPMRVPGTENYSFVRVERITKDRACNLVSNALIREGKLDWTQTMRSNDLMWGTPYNFMQWITIAELVATRVGVPLGSYHHFANSLHVYKKHWSDLRNIRFFNLYQAMPECHNVKMNAEWVTDELNSKALIVERTARAGGPRIDVSPWWDAKLLILQAHQAYKNKQDDLALDLLLQSKDQIYAMAQIRFYYYWRWHKMPDMVARVKDLPWSSAALTWVLADTASNS